MSSFFDLFRERKLVDVLLSSDNVNIVVICAVVATTIASTPFVVKKVFGISYHDSIFGVDPQIAINNEVALRFNALYQDHIYFKVNCVDTINRVDVEMTRLDNLYGSLANRITVSNSAADTINAGLVAETDNIRLALANHITVGHGVAPAQQMPVPENNLRQVVADAINERFNAFNMHAPAVRPGFGFRTNINPETLQEIGRNMRGQPNYFNPGLEEYLGFLGYNVPDAAVPGVIGVNPSYVLFTMLGAACAWAYHNPEIVIALFSEKKTGFFNVFSGMWE